MYIYANLHTHSTHSDGEYSPSELVRIAKEEGYKAIAVTDHDIGTGYPELKETCKKENIECIFGVEFSVKDPYDFHIVGFDFDAEHPKMKEYFSIQAYNSKYTTKMCFEEAVEKGNITGITWEEILEYNKDISRLCNNHVFRAMQNKGLIDKSQYMDWFNKNFRNQRGKYKLPDSFFTLKQVIRLIKEAGGIAICAHPCSQQLDRFSLLKEAGIDGLEVLHPDLNEAERKRAFKLCIDNNLYISGGSDHSGLCGGLYDSFSTKEELEQSFHYIKPLSVGTYEWCFREIQTRTILKENRRADL